MARSRGVLGLGLLLVGLVPALGGRVFATRAPEPVPARLSDTEFWRLVDELSEPNGYFQSDNLVGNERPMQQVVPALSELKRGGAYLGVAPDQNFTYVIALEPRIAFIVDIRRGNLLEHLMYKAVIELSETRAEFLSRLFSLPRSEVDTGATAAELFRGYWTAEPDAAAFQENLKAITDQLVRVHGFPLSSDDVDGIRSIYEQFFRFGPALTYSSSSGGGGGRNMPTYAELQQATDLEGRERGYLATEENYRKLRNFEQRNLLVPVVGDFAGRKALRGVGAWLVAHDAAVTAFYVSNVEQYLFRNAVAQEFYANVATLPLDDNAVFIRSASGRSVIDPVRAVLNEFAAGRLKVYMDVTSRGAIR
jgi:hypothetical protein